MFGGIPLLCIAIQLVKRPSSLAVKLQNVRVEFPAKEEYEQLSHLLFLSILVSYHNVGLCVMVSRVIPMLLAVS